MDLTSWHFNGDCLYERNSIMYELVYHNLDIEKFFLVDGVIIYHTLLPNIIEWIGTTEMHIAASMAAYINLTSVEVSGKLVDFYFPKRYKIKTLTLRFESKEDRNLFKLTWG